jgi:hypothetical protein
MTTIEMLKARMDSFHSKADAVLAIMQWLHDNDYAVCIFTPKELEATSLSADDVEAAMCSSANDAIDFNPVQSESDDD